MSRHVYSLLCLGDSYTIGEGLPLTQSFPYQLVQKLRNEGIHIHAPEVVAQTGWTSFELGDFMIRYSFSEPYDFVTLLCGVNNQYRGLPIEEYKEQFAFLLRKAVHLAGGRGQRVAVISIPDWGVTPFAKDRDVIKIAAEIDAYNEANKRLAEEQQVFYLELTDHSRNAGVISTNLTADELHYGSEIYAVWAEKLKSWIMSLL